MNGLLTNPMFNMGIGLLSSRGRPEGLLTGMNQLNQNVRASQAQQYQAAIMEQMKKKATQEAQQKILQDQANRMAATTMVPGAGPVMPGMQPPQEPQLNENLYTQFQADPAFRADYLKSQLPKPSAPPNSWEEYLASQGLPLNTPPSPELAKNYESFIMRKAREGSPKTEISLGERKAQVEAQKELMGIDKGINLVSDLVSIVDKNPDVVGGIGAARQSVGGVIGSVGENLGLDFVQSAGGFIAPEQKEAWDIKSGYLRAQLLPSVLNDTSRFSDKDMQLVKEAITITDNARSGRQAKEALLLIEDVLKGDRELAEKRYETLTGIKPESRDDSPKLSEEQRARLEELRRKHGR